MKRRRFDSEFKAKVALEAIPGNLTIAELSNKYSIGPTQIKAWKAELLAKASAVFSKDTKPVQDNSELVAALERKGSPLYKLPSNLKKLFSLSWVIQWRGRKSEWIGKI